MKHPHSLYIIWMMALACMVSCTKTTSPTDPDNPPGTGPGTGTNPTEKPHLSWQGSAFEAAYQQSGRLVCLGYIAKAGHENARALRAYRLYNTDSIDASFDTSTLGKVFKGGISPGKMVLQPDDKLLMDGEFVIDGKTIYLIRLLPDGTLDMPFINKVNMTDKVKDYELAPDGNIIVVKGSVRELVKLAQDGTKDNSYALREPYYFSNWAPSSIRLLPDGSLLLLNFQEMIRLKNDGMRDPSFSFNYTLGAGSPSDYTTLSHAYMQDGKILVTGLFTKLTDKADATKNYNYRNLIRLNANGSVDATFYNAANSDGASVFSLLADGSLLRSESKLTYTNNWQDILHHLDKNGNNIGDTPVNGMIEKIIKVNGNKLLLAGNFFEPYLELELGLNKYIADPKPLKEVTIQ